ncbi:hypothetical protein KP509_22G046100 [Ceratopteris richardii]|uniref:Transmembrane protein n=1 Tax=Ceratopteris richardii TaxID=49495 RepID=A0A8T2S6M1_CERRI|nr:hypothetical protein KP509_22G046100 [Ceratopteris richardii]
MHISNIYPYTGWRMAKLSSCSMSSVRHLLCCPSATRSGSYAWRMAFPAKTFYSPTCVQLSDEGYLALSRQLRVRPVIGLIKNCFAVLPAWAADVNSSSSASAVVASSVAEDVGSSLKDAGAAASQSLQSSVENIGRVDPSTAASQASGTLNAGEADLIINVLGTLAFVALSLLTIGVAYLFLSDFLEKRRSDEEMKRLNEEEAARRKRKGPRATVMKDGPKGFGSKPRFDDE